MSTGRGLPFGPLHDRLLRQAYTNHRPNHLKIEEYLDTSLFRLDCARLCVDAVELVLRASDRLSDAELDVGLLKETESCIFFLASALDAFAHVINLCCRLGLSEEPGGRRGPELVSIHSVLAHLAQQNKWRGADLATYATQEREKTWFPELRELRNRLTHRRFLTFEITRDTRRLARAYVTATDTTGPFPSVPHTSANQVEELLRLHLGHVEAFTWHAMNHLLAHLEHT